MLAIQVILCIMALALFFLFTQRAHTVRTQAAKRIGFVLFILGAVYAILRPQDVNWIAHKLGVGRGADLVLYLLVVVVAFFAANTFLRFRNLERRFTDLARAVALNDAVAPVPGPRRESDALTGAEERDTAGTDAAIEADADAVDTVETVAVETVETVDADEDTAAEQPVPAASGRKS